MPSQVSGVDPNAVKRRIDISMDMPAFAFTNSDNAWRVTPRAALVTESPSGSRHSRRTIPPGCEGLCKLMIDALIIFRAANIMDLDTRSAL